MGVDKIEVKKERKIIIHYHHRDTIVDNCHRGTFTVHNQKIITRVMFYVYFTKKIIRSKNSEKF